MLWGNQIPGGEHGRVVVRWGASATISHLFEALFVFEANAIWDGHLPNLWEVFSWVVIFIISRVMMSHQWRQRSWTSQEERLKITIKLNISAKYVTRLALGCWVSESRGVATNKKKGLHWQWLWFLLECTCTISSQIEIFLDRTGKGEWWGGMYRGEDGRTMPVK